MPEKNHFFKRKLQNHKKLLKAIFWEDGQNWVKSESDILRIASFSNILVKTMIVATCEIFFWTFPIVSTPLNLGGSWVLVKSKQGGGVECLNFLRGVAS